MTALIISCSPSIGTAKESVAVESTAPEEDEATDASTEDEWSAMGFKVYDAETKPSTETKPDTKAESDAETTADAKTEDETKWEAMGFVANDNKEEAEKDEWEAMGFVANENKESSEAKEANTESKGEIGKHAGELANGVHYDYNEYTDFKNKKSEQSFGYDKSESFGDREKFINEWLKMANKGPEYLSAYVYYFFTEGEKAEVGIANMSIEEIDDYMSNANNLDGGEMQSRIFALLESIAKDEENTAYKFYYENGEEDSYYLTFVDVNEDGHFTPDELKVYYSTVMRSNTPQCAVYRLLPQGENGEKVWVKMIDLNLPCGIQTNIEKAPNLPYISPEASPIGGQ